MAIIQNRATGESKPMSEGGWRGANSRDKPVIWPQRTGQRLKLKAVSKHAGVHSTAWRGEEEHRSKTRTITRVPRAPSPQLGRHPKTRGIQPELKSQDQDRLLVNYYLTIFAGVNTVHLKGHGWVFSQTEPSSDPVLKFTRRVTLCRVPNP